MALDANGSIAEIPAGPGRLKDGFNLIARDLDRAFVLAMLGTYEAVVLQAVREGSWAVPLRTRKKGEPRPDPVPCRLNLCEMARGTGLTRQLLSRALKSLVAARILARYDDGSVLINKDYSTWVEGPSNDGPVLLRFTPEQLSYIRHETAAVTTPARHPAASTAAVDAAPVPPVLQPGSCTGLQPTGSRGCNPGVAPGDRGATQELQVVQPTGSRPETLGLQPPIEERGRVDFEIKEREINIIPLPPSGSTLQPQSEPRAFDKKDCPNFPGPDLIEVVPGPHPMSDADCRRLFVMIWRAFGEAKMCYDFYQKQQEFPFDFWVAGVRETVKTGKAITALRYVERVIGNFRGAIPRVELTETIEIKPPPKKPVYYTRRSTRPIKFVPRDGTRG